MKIFDFTIQKKGENKKSNQDAYAFDVKQRIFAISDGVSRSSFSDIWSKRIVEHFLKIPFESDSIKNEYLKKWLEPIKSKLDEEIVQMDINPMILDVAKENGSSATFLGMRIKKENRQRRISIWAVGDSNIFQIRKNKIINLFPIKKVKDFSFSTYAITSFIDKQEIDVIHDEWIILGGDILVLSTDAFSKWLLDSYVKGQKPWKKIIKNYSKMKNFIEYLRLQNKIENDDTTFILIQF